MTLKLLLITILDFALLVFLKNWLFKTWKEFFRAFWYLIVPKMFWVVLQKVEDFTKYGDKLVLILIILGIAITIEIKIFY